MSGFISELAGFRDAINVTLDGSTDQIFRNGSRARNARIIQANASGDVAIWFTGNQSSDAAIFTLAAGGIVVGEIVGIDASLSDNISIVVGW